MARGSGDSPLDRTLRNIFGRVPDTARVKATPFNDGLPVEIVERPTAGLGGIMEERNPSVIGNLPGATYAGGPQTQQQGLRGQISQDLMRRWDHLFMGKNPAVCGPVNTHECADIISRLLEQTFRNFQLTARPPSHIAPPFSATPIDVFPVAGNIPVPIGAFVVVASFTMPTGNYRGVISALGQALESEAAFADVVWRVQKNGQVVFPPGTWTAAHAYQFSPPTRLSSPIHLRGGDTVTFEAAAVLGGAHLALARLFGWFYPVRVNMDNIGATLVD